MRHKYNADLRRVHLDQVPTLWPELYKMACQHPRGFEWYSNAADSTQGYICRDGCGQRCDFNPDYFYFEGNVKPLDAPNPEATKTITFAKEGTKMGKL